ncbi:MAG: Gfo/Idh/MocA family oxidoreductase [Clostridia bacterium]|nr:Gfo/Idh/MocA family oxidoreductase [Clostridia bacterium]
MVPIGIIGCGVISGIYFKTLTTVMKNVRIVACADLIEEKAKTAAETYGIPKFCSVEELLADPEIRIVVNLTIPKAHYDICKAALLAGKSVHVEKPLAVTREQGAELVALAAERGLFLGGAPDTFLGAGNQTCRKLIDDGWIGTPIAAAVNMIGHGHEGWHPDPAFYYQAGGGPVFDMAPYYLSGLVNLLGPVRTVLGEAKTTFAQRTVTSAPKFGTVIDVEVPTHVNGILTFAGGATASLTMSFDVWGSTQPRFEIYGTEGSIQVPDPNQFGGDVLVRRHDRKEWTAMPYSHGYSENSRGLGVADMAQCILDGRPRGSNRCSGELAYHVLDVMHALHDAARKGRRVTLESTVDRPRPMTMKLLPGAVE